MIFAVYERTWAWGAWGPSVRWSLLERFADRLAAEAKAAAVQGLVVREAAAA